MTQRKLLILDVDETLVHSTEKPICRAADFTAGPYLVHKRPHVDHLLATGGSLFDVAVWSAGTADYVQEVVDRVIVPHATPLFVWSRERCTRRVTCADEGWGEEYFLKDLNKVRRHLGFDLRSVLIVDDDKRTASRNYGNVIYVNPYHGEAEDEELLHLTRYLTSLQEVSDVRKIEKRGWRKKTVSS